MKFTDFLVSSTGKTSITRVAMLVGIITSTYIVIRMEMRGTLTFDFFTMYVLTMFGTNSLAKGINTFKDIKSIEYDKELSRRESLMQDRYSQDYDEQPLPQRSRVTADTLTQEEKRKRYDRLDD